MAPTPRVPQAHLEAWSAVLGAQATIVADVEAALVDAGLPPLAWYDVLWPLHRAGAPMRMGGLAASVTTIGRTGLTRLVDRLEARGLLVRSACAEDRRGTEVAITAAGSDVLRRMWPVYAAVLGRRLPAAMTEAAARAVRDALTPLGVPAAPVPGAPGRSRGTGASVPAKGRLRLQNE